MSSIQERYQRLQDRLGRAAASAGRPADAIQLVAVSKTVTAEQVRAAWAAGQRAFGENRAQELSAKARTLGDLDIAWHFIGHLQTNKVRLVMPTASLIHSVDSAPLAAKISRRAAPDASQPILVQVNTTGETSKSGVDVEALPGLLDEITGLAHIDVAGLMTIGPWTEDTLRIGNAFRSLRRALETERQRGRPAASLQHLSMGMSHDLEIAIAEGATIVRVGTALFGQRPG